MQNLREYPLCFVQNLLQSFEERHTNWIADEPEILGPSVRTLELADKIVHAAISELYFDMINTG